VADKLRSLLESFSKRFVKILALSAVEPDTGKSGWLAVRDSTGEDLSSCYSRSYITYAYV